MRQTFVIIGLLVLLGSMSACGGGGGGGGGGSSGGVTTPLQPIAYQGNTSPGAITTSNAKSLLNAVLGSSTTSGSLLRNVSAVDGKSIGAIALAEKLQSVLQTHLVERMDDGRILARAVINESEDCIDAGSVTVVGNIDDATGLGNLTARFNNCSELGSILDGEVIYRILGYNAGTVTSQVTDFTLLRFRDSSFDVSMSGSIASSLNGGTESQTHNTVTRDNVSGRMSKVENLLVSVVGSGPVLLSITGGRIYDSVEGYVELSTIAALSFSSVDVDFPNSGGPLVLTGLGGTRLVATPLSSGGFAFSVKLEVDTDGDGGIDATVLSSWDNLNTPFANGIRLISLATNGLVYDSVRGRIYAGVSASAISHANSIAVIDPVSGTVVSYLPVGSDPRKLAISAGAEYLYFAFNGGTSVGRIDLETMTLGLTFALGTDTTFSQPYCAQDIEVFPDNPHAIAIARCVSNLHGGVAVYDDGVVRPNAAPSTGAMGSGVIQFGASSARLYGYNNVNTESGFQRMTLDASGVVLNDSTTTLIPYPGGDIKYDAGMLYTGRGQAINPETQSVLGTFTFSFFDPSSRLVRPDSAQQSIYFLSRDTFYWQLESFNISTFTKRGSLIIPGLRAIAGVNPSSLIRWGTSGLAFRADDLVFPANETYVYLVNTDQIR